MLQSVNRISPWELKVCGVDLKNWNNGKGLFFLLDVGLAFDLVALRASLGKQIAEYR